jgi:flagellar biosynthesis protein FliR
LAGSRAVPAIVRLALALAVAPLAEPKFNGASPSGPLSEFVLAAGFGAATGLGASIVAGAAAAAGGLIDSALAGGVTVPDRVFGQSAGPFGVLVQMAFAVAMTSSGALTWLIAAYAYASSALVTTGVSVEMSRHAQHIDASSVGALGRTVFSAALAIALPALCAHSLGALLAGIVARLTPRVNGMLLAPALGSMLVLAVTAAGAFGMFFAMIELARLMVRAGIV